MLLNSSDLMLPLLIMQLIAVALSHVTLKYEKF